MALNAVNFLYYQHSPPPVQKSINQSLLNLQLRAAGKEEVLFPFNIISLNATTNQNVLPLQF